MAIFSVEILVKDKVDNYYAKYAGDDDCCCISENRSEGSVSQEDKEGCKEAFEDGLTDHGEAVKVHSFEADECRLSSCTKSLGKDNDGRDSDERFYLGSVEHIYG